jgi:hypothetical protein
MRCSGSAARLRGSPAHTVNTLRRMVTLWPQKRVEIFAVHQPPGAFQYSAVLRYQRTQPLMRC